MLGTLHIQIKRLPVLLVLGFMGLSLTGCGDGSPFVATPAVSLAVGGTTIEIGEVKTVGLVLSTPAPKSITVGLVSTGDTDKFTGIPERVQISSGESAAVFQVTTSQDAEEDNTLEIRVVPGVDYSVGSPSTITLKVTRTQLTQTTSLEGGDQLVSQGGEASFSVFRSTDAGEMEVDILAVPGTAGFSIPQSVTLTDGSYNQEFNVGVVGESGWVDIYILAPEGFSTADPFKARVTIQEP